MTTGAFDFLGGPGAKAPLSFAAYAGLKACSSTRVFRLPSCARLDSPRAAVPTWLMRVDGNLGMMLSRDVAGPEIFRARV
jgi:hypothetical protein